MAKHDLVSPVDLAPDPAGGGAPLRWTASVIIVATLLLALFNAGALVNWAQGLPPSTANARIVAAAQGWYGMTEALGLTRPGETIRTAYDTIKAARFNPEKPQ